MTIVPLEDLEYLAGKFGIESLAAQLVLTNVSLGEVFIVEVVHPSILLFRHISESVECLNIPIVAQSGEGVSTLVKKYLHLVEVLEDGVGHYNV